MELGVRLTPIPIETDELEGELFTSRHATYGLGSKRKAPQQEGRALKSPKIDHTTSSYAAPMLPLGGLPVHSLEYRQNNATSGLQQQQQQRQANQLGEFSSRMVRKLICWICLT